MGEDFKKIIRENFSKGTLEELNRHLKGKRFRVHLLRREFVRDLDMICTIRDFEHRNAKDEVYLSVEDFDFEVISGSVIPGTYTRIVKEENSESITVLEKSYSNPNIGRVEPILLVKGSTKTNLDAGYFNKVFHEVYAII